MYAAKDYTKIYEQSMADDLYYRLSAINLDFQDISLGEVDGEILNHYSEDYDLFAMAIIAKNKDGIYSANLKNMLDEFYSEGMEIGKKP